MATEFLMKLTDGSSQTITIGDGSGGAVSYRLAYPSWAPNVASLRLSDMGGRGPYSEVIETMELIVTGATVPTVLANVAALARILDTAERWSRRESHRPVEFLFSPKGATVSTAADPFRTTVLGRAAKDEVSPIQMLPDLADLTAANLYCTVRISFWRTGLWRHTVDNWTSASVNNGDLATTTTSPAMNTPSPTEVLFNNVGYGKSSGKVWWSGFVLLGEDTSDDGVASVSPIVILNAEGGTATGYTSVADSGRNARNTNVLRYTPTTTNEAFSGNIGAANFPGSPIGLNDKWVAVFANIRNSDQANYLVRARISSDGALAQDTPQTLIQKSGGAIAQYPRWVFLGMVNVVGNVDEVYLACTADATASTFLDIDTVVLCDMRYTHILAIIGQEDEIATLEAVGGLDVMGSISLSNNTPDPLVFHNATRMVPYSGDPAWHTRGGTLYTLVLLTGGGTGAGGDEYRQANTSTDAVLAGTHQIVRDRAYLVPE